MNQQLSIFDPTPTLPAINRQTASFVGMPTQQELMVYEIWAKNAVESQMYRSIGKEAAVMMIILAAREYGIPPAMALNGGLKIINGNVELSSRMMESLIRRAGHSIKKVELTNETCTLRGKRADNLETMEATFTLEEARLAGLVKEASGWKKYPQDMVYARALSRLARRLFADVIGVGYIQGEISGNDVEVIDNQQHTDEDLIKHFPDVDMKQFDEFILGIMQHYKWSRDVVIRECLKDKEKTMERFNDWRKSVA